MQIGFISSTKLSALCKSRHQIPASFQNPLFKSPGDIGLQFLFLTETMLAGHNVPELHSTLTVTRQWIHRDQNETLKAVKPTTVPTVWRSKSQTDADRPPFMKPRSVAHSPLLRRGGPFPPDPAQIRANRQSFLPATGAARTSAKQPLVAPATNFKERHTAKGPIRSGVFKGGDYYWPSKGKKTAPAADPLGSGGEAFPCHLEEKELRGRLLDAEGKKRVMHSQCNLVKYNRKSWQESRAVPSSQRWLLAIAWTTFYSFVDMVVADNAEIKKWRDLLTDLI